MARDPGRAQRLKQMKTRVRTLVNQGVAFNPATASHVAIDNAVGNIRTSGSGVRIGQQSVGAAIQDRQAGSASSPKGGPAKFTPVR